MNREYPIQVTEFNEDEIQDFIEVKNKEMHLDLSTENKKLVSKIKEMSGGLPLAIQWILGEYSKTRELDNILSRSLSPDSPTS